MLGLEEGIRLGRCVPVGPEVLGRLVGEKEILGVSEGGIEGRRLGEIEGTREGVIEGLPVFVGVRVGALLGEREGSAKKCATLSGRAWVKDSSVLETDVFAGVV